MIVLNSNINTNIFYIIYLGCCNTIVDWVYRSMGRRLDMYIHVLYNIYLYKNSLIDIPECVFNNTYSPKTIKHE